MRVGRQSVDVVKGPREWNRHDVVIAASAPTLSLLKADASLGDALEVRVYAAIPLYMIAIAAGILSLLAAAFAALLRGRDARMFYVGGLAAALLTGVIGSAWAWLGEPLLPLVGASVSGILGGWVVGRLLMLVAPKLPWAAH